MLNYDNNENEQDIEDSIKIILVGNSGVGKTAIINRYIMDTFTDELKPTLTMNYIEKIIEINNKNIKINIWDTAGQEQYRSVNKLFIKNSKIVIFVYDITSKESFKDLDYWIKFIKNELGQMVLLGLAGNKMDLIEKEEVSEEEGKELAKKLDAFFYLLSAKNDKEGIDTFFYELVKKYLKSFFFDFQQIEKLERKTTIVLKDNESTRTVNRGGNCCSGGKKNHNDFKIIFLGANGVGKSDIIRAIRGKKISDKYEHTTNICKKKYICILNNKTKIHVSIYDTNGDGLKNDDIIDKLKYCDIFFLVFDINKKSTFNELENWAKEIKKNSENKYFLNILGNEISPLKEEDEMIIKEEAEKLANEYDGHYEKISVNNIDIVKNLIKDNIEKYLKN